MRKRTRKLVQEKLVAVGVEALLLEKEALPCLRFDGSVEVERIVRGLLPTDRLCAWGGDAPPFDRHQPDAALILAKQANRAGSPAAGLLAGSYTRKTSRKPASESYLVLLFFLGWLGRGAFGFAPSS